MTALGHELRLVQNPALGAAVIWRFAGSYSESHQLHAPAPLPLCAVVLPMTWHQETADLISSTQIAKGLRAFADKFSDTRNSRLDVLLALNQRAIRWKEKTMESLQMGFACGLLRMTSEGGVIGGDVPWPGQLPKSIVEQGKVAEKLGNWFAAMSLREIAAVLHLRF